MKTVDENTPIGTIVRCGDELWKLHDCDEGIAKLNPIEQIDNSVWPGKEWDYHANVFIVDEPGFVYDCNSEYVTVKDELIVEILSVVDLTPFRKAIVGLVTLDNGHKVIIQWDMDGTCHNVNLNLKQKPVKVLEQDQPIWVRFSDTDGWVPAHFAYMRKRVCYVWVGGMTSHTSDINDVFAVSNWTDENPNR